MWDVSLRPQTTRKLIGRSRRRVKEVEEIKEMLYVVRRVIVE